VNCLGVRSGTSVQNVLMVLKLGAVAALVFVGLTYRGGAALHFRPILDRPVSFGLLSAMGAALTPVLFAYGGWQTSSFMSAELKNPRRDLARGLMLGVIGVITLYLAVNWVCLRALGADGLAGTTTPASAVMRLALGEQGARWTAIAIAISTLGFLSQGMLTAPRVYFAMAADGLFLRQVAWVSPSTRVPVVSIAMQGAMAVVIALSGRYEQILNYVVSVDFIFFGLTGAALFVFRKRDRSHADFRVPGHPFTTALFVIACACVVAATVYAYPSNSLIGMGILAAGVPAYYFWRRRT
jgi:APA family basic amino acid/polyamine antiporter